MNPIQKAIVYLLVLRGVFTSRSFTFSYVVNGLRYNATFSACGQSAPACPPGVSIRDIDATGLASLVASNFDGPVGPLYFKVGSTWYTVSSVLA